jgi:concentrative nucleoside transporter, CNT family
MSLVSVFRGLLGLLVLIALAWVFSKNRKRVNWPLVIKGILIQILFAIAILRVPMVEGFSKP